MRVGATRSGTACHALFGRRRGRWRERGAGRRFVVVELSSKYSQLAKKSKSLKPVLGRLPVASRRARSMMLFAKSCLRVPRPLIWMKSVGEKIGRRDRCSAGPRSRSRWSSCRRCTQNRVCEVLYRGRSCRSPCRLLFANCSVNSWASGTAR